MRLRPPRAGQRPTSSAPPPPLPRGPRVRPAHRANCRGSRPGQAKTRRRLRIRIVVGSRRGDGWDSHKTMMMIIGLGYVTCGQCKPTRERRRRGDGRNGIFAEVYTS
ncbi:hypothetical protein Zmor_010651 [Zophobas morio]|uniref:Uncharacterized protein n=1 Tax=Zophobas morio TaxID=2755281 RepID=A0AA38IPZ3_9CUCU|nr:hypothetical protein Zmor_010651 [Zophobas morio]